MSESDPEGVQIPDWQIAVEGTTFLLFGTICIVLAIIHGLKTYRDLYTEQRISLKHRKALPSINFLYKLSAILTTISVSSFAMLLLSGSIGRNFCYGDHSLLLSSIQFLSFQFAKGSMYLLYIVRLHIVYGKSAYGYNSKCLSIVGITLTLLILVFTVSLLIAYTGDEKQYLDNNNKYPHYCESTIEDETTNAILYGGIVLFDITFSIGSLIAFIIPLNRVIKNIDKLDERVYNKMVFAGTKYKVIVITASVSTVLWILLSLSGSVLLATIAGAIDFLLNPICIMLMTAYYPDKVYYRRLCGCCIICCDRQKRSKKNNSDDNEKQDVGLEPSRTTVTTSATSGEQISSNPSRTNVTASPTSVISSNPSSIDTDIAIKLAVNDTDPQPVKSDEEDSFVNK